MPDNNGSAVQESNNEEVPVTKDSKSNGYANGDSNGGNEPKPMRSELDTAKIYNSITNGTQDQEKNSISRVNSNLSREHDNIIPNPWTIFNRYADEQEQRYKSDDQEQADSTPNGPEHHEQFFDTNSKPDSRMSYSNVIAEEFKMKNEQRPDDESRPKRKKFQIFRKKDKNRKQSINIPTHISEDDTDAAAGERAADLIAKLSFGPPAISIIASCFLEDEHGLSRSPLLLSMLGFKVIDISPSAHSKLRRFRIDLEYGIWPKRMKWSVEKNTKDLLYMHSKFKIENWKTGFSSNLPKLPRPPVLARGETRSRPKSQFPAQGSDYPGIDEAMENNGQDDDLPSVNESVNSNHSNHTNHTFRHHLSLLRNHVTNLSLSTDGDNESPEQLRNRISRNKQYIDAVTKYLQALIQKVSLRPNSNRLFSFFELSPISSLLSYELGYSGKQGLIHIGGTSRAQGWRVGHFNVDDVRGMIVRRSDKWLLIRNSYVMYVSNINSTSPLEVFLVDTHFKITYRDDSSSTRDEEESEIEDASMVEKKIKSTMDTLATPKNVFEHLKITLENRERQLVLSPKSKRDQLAWIESLNNMKDSTIWSQENRFGSFAPIRRNCFAQWFVDARDHFWAVSSAIEMAKDVIYIHDWWLSPELYMRRPANGNQQWRLDRLLLRKAQQGVKIFVIIYRNVGTTVPTDSLYTKHSLLSLHEDNIHVIRSPNQLLQNTYFWAHHEKLCIIDHTIAFVGGIDLCYGRYDTPDHVLVDDSKVNFKYLATEKQASEEDVVKFQTFPGKDYSNPRVKDFFGLDKPYESMYDRDSVPRMPWHDIHMVTSGKVARDLGRHFVQRWNYLLRQKRPSRLTPLLIPPLDMSDEEAASMGLQGTCDVQLLRSSGNWSLGLKEHEQSIQNAYLKLIETSERFVYIENQFFISSCFIDGNEIQNRIGDALVDRIIRAHNEGTYWKAVIMIPLMPGFESQVDQPEGSSVRVIMQCQYMTISRGMTSIYAKLRKYGIEPEDYIQFFSLRKWGRIGPDRNLVTEQLYIHAKTMIVDDRVAIIGSANINERSMRGLRDSEVAAVVEDKDIIKSTMGGEPFKVAKFAHSLRMRLMREHLGVDVDIVDVVERRFRRYENFAKTPEGLKAVTNKFKSKENAEISAMVELVARDVLGEDSGTFRWKNFQAAHKLQDPIPEVPLQDIREHEELHSMPTPLSLPVSFNNRTGSHEANRGIRDKKKHSYDARVQHNENHKRDVYGEGLDKYRSKLSKLARLSSSKMLRQLANEVMGKASGKPFLPDFDAVNDFINSEDFDMVDEMDEESERIITERNRERWLLLKKMAYFQRVAAKEKANNDKEAKKRSKAGYESLVSQKFGQEPPSRKVSTSMSVDEIKLPHEEKPDDDLLRPTESLNNSADIKSELSTPEMLNDRTPIVTLNERSASDIIENIDSRGTESKNAFIDPWGFEDPLREDFFDDLWWENARRNTEIYGLVFHCQPHNQVQTWNDYKLYSRLNRAFKASQEHEAKRRRRKAARLGHGLSDEETDEDLYIASSAGKEDGSASIQVDRFHHNGLLGDIPPGTAGSDLNQMKLDEHLLNGDKSKPDSGHHAEYNTSHAESSAPKVDNAATPGARRRRPRHHYSSRRRAHLEHVIFERDSAERLLQEIRGHIVLFPTEWLLRELDGGNWFYNTDRIPPIDIYD